MFRKAVDLARRFTVPVVISAQQKNGRCASAIGACVVVNSDGWIVTARHVLELFGQYTAQVQTAQAHAMTAAEAGSA